ncbi:hypothetical protein WJ970_24920 [Achromobacter xylosoxidans]
MTISTLVQLIGHTSASAALQDCMLGLGMKKMPKGDSTTRVRTQDKLVSLEFDPTESYMGRNVREPVGDGGFTLESFDVHQGYLGELPFGLSLAMDRQQVDAALGRALDEDPKAEVQTYRRDDFLIIVFYGGKGRKIDTFRFTRPNVHSARKFNIELQAAAAETPGAAQPLSAPELLSFLGASPDDAAFVAWLDQHGIHDRPHAAPGVDGHGAASDETLREARLSEIDENERHGVALIYESRENHGTGCFPPKLRGRASSSSRRPSTARAFPTRRIPGRASFRLALRRRTGAGSGKALRPDRPPRAAWTAGGTLGRQGLASEHQLHGGRQPRRHRACAQAKSLRSGDDRRRFIGSIPERARPGKVECGHRPGRG